jgi:SAM-dependent methyltransferase
VNAGNRQGESDKRPIRIGAEQLHHISEVTIAHYDRLAKGFWDGTRDHDVSQNYAALLDAIEGDPPYSILDLGCGPGRDLRYFRSLGHDAVGLDGSKEFVAMARSYSGCEVLHQDFLAMAYRKVASTACLRMRRFSTCRAKSYRGYCSNSPKP